MTQCVALTVLTAAPAMPVILLIAHNIGEVEARSFAWSEGNVEQPIGPYPIPYVA